jgi:tRNA threonylcarbamoyl adenosine modification protein YeaZ
MLTLAFDTATDVATSAVVHDDQPLAESASKAVRILAAIDELLAEAGASRDDLQAIAVGTGPGSYTGLRMGLITARVLSLTLGIPVAGVSTLDALAHGTPGAVPVIDARRREVFTLADGLPIVLSPAELELPPAAVAVGDGAVRYREVLEAHGTRVPPDDDPAHIPWARHHAALASDFGPAEAAEPIYLRIPDAERAMRA